MSHHKKFSPSSLPVLNICPLFESGGEGGGDTEDRDMGTVMHGYLARRLEIKASGTPLIGRLLPTTQEGKIDLDGRERLDWAIDRIWMEVSSEWPVSIEQTLHLIDDDFNEVTYGTADVVNGPNIFDLKTGERNDEFYWFQLACYALMQMRAGGFDRARCHLVYTRWRQIYSFDVTREEAEEAVFGLIEYLESPAPKKPVPNDKCKWCSKQLTCEGPAAMAMAIASGREDWELENYHSSQINEPVEMAKAWRLAHLMEKWVEAVKFQAKQMALAGIPLPGLVLKDRAGSRYVEGTPGDVYKVLTDAKISIPREQFLEACSLALGKLEDIYVELEGGVKAAAKRKLNEALEPIMRAGKPIQFLQVDKPKALKTPKPRKPRKKSPNTKTN